MKVPCYLCKLLITDIKWDSTPRPIGYCPTKQQYCWVKHRNCDEEWEFSMSELKDNHEEEPFLKIGLKFDDLIKVIP